VKRLLPLLLLAGACNPPPPTDVAHTGPPTTDAPEVLPLVVDRVPYQPAPTTAPTTTHTHPPTTQAVVPLTTEPVVVATARSGDCGGWRDHVAAAFPGEVDYACRVFIGCESGGNPNAVSATADHGLAQINEPTWNKPGHHDPVADWIGRHWHAVYDPATNLEMARRIRAAYGWQMWSCA